MTVNPPLPDASVPRELSMQDMPPYVIGPPDVLLVQVLLPPKNQPYEEYYSGIKRERPAAPGAVEASQSEYLQSPLSRPVAPVPIDGQHMVAMDGTIKLGIYGTVKVSGLTRDQAQERIRHFMAEMTGNKPEEFQVNVDVVAWNSKTYYVLTDLAGYGEQVFEFPVTGNDTVLSAVARIGGLPAVASKRHVWVARRSPHGGQEQILPVDWVSMTQGGSAATNYQVLPGDRVYVMSQRVIGITNTIDKFLQPIDRVFGTILLGSSTVQTIQGRNFNNNNNP